MDQVRQTARTKVLEGPIEDKGVKDGEGFRYSFLAASLMWTKTHGLIDKDKGTECGVICLAFFDIALFLQ